MDTLYISDLIRSDFQSVLKFKWTGGSLEVSTPFAMANRDVVAVLVTQEGGGFLCSIDLDMGRLTRAKKQRRAELMARNGLFACGDHYYKKVYTPQSIGSAIVDLAEFAVASSWLFGVKPGDET